MTTNQTIDGVPRELLADLASYGESGKVPEPWMVEKLRALLDGPAETEAVHEVQWISIHGPEVWKVVDAPTYHRCTGPLWNRRITHMPAAQPQGATSEVVAFGIQVEKLLCDALGREWSASGISIESLVAELKGKRQGDPVAWLGSGLPFARQQDAIEYASYKDKQVTPLYAEQPAPVTMVPDGYCIMPRQLTAENGAKALLLGEFKLLVTKECPECCELEEPTEGCSICDGEGEFGQKHTIPWDQIKYIYSKAVSGLAMKTEPAKSR